MRSLLLAGAGALAAGIAPCVVAAQAAPSFTRVTRPLPAQAAADPDSTTRVRFEIPALPLPEALAEFARQAGVRVAVDTALGRAPAGAVEGRLTPGEAMQRLLAGTGYAARFRDATTVVVGTGRAAERTGRTAELAAVRVTGTVARTRGYAAPRSTAALRGLDAPLRDVPQAVTVVTHELMADQAMTSMQDVVRYVPGVVMGQGEGHRDAPTIRGQSSTADFFLDGVRDDVQYQRDVYNLEQVEALKGSSAMTFGRGGGGGVINRVSKQAGWTPTRGVTVQGGSFDNRRGTVDVGQGVNDRVAVRVNGMFENSGGFRDAFGLERFGLNPTLTWVAGARTTARLSYELFDDERVVDRGIPSFQGRPSSASPTTFFGNADSSTSRFNSHAVGGTLEHTTARGLSIRNRTQWSTFDKHYQNVFPGAVNAAGTQVSIAAYGNTTHRTNLFNQTDLTATARTGRVAHALLGGVEVGRQATDNFRTTGYFNNTATSVSVPFTAPIATAPVTWRQSATDGDNGTTVHVQSLYLQDLVTLSPRWQLLAGVRVERFDLRFRDDRTGNVLAREDRMVAPRAGLVYKPVTPLSLYGSWSVSYLPSAGDQFSSITATSQTLRPEAFRNRELGVKWDVRPALALTAALYQLDRTNTTAPDPLDATRLVQTGAQRTNGWELGVSGSVTDRWQVAGGLAAQTATIRSRTSAAAAGKTVPLVPHATASLWNRYQVASRLGLGLGVVHQGDMYAAIDNAVTLPGFTRLDAAAFVTVTPLLRAQLNVENLLDRRYFATSHGNNNIMPGASRTLRLSLVAGRR